jgi:hypothetical protein
MKTTLPSMQTMEAYSFILDHEIKARQAEPFLTILTIFVCGEAKKNALGFGNER